ncbi:hypothetical protein [Caulobacter mirabilis]|uniref:Uncharacterized protein n=1 Tax=Caulobacter mirabilis TaxID=69666 RepID=A0A2D2AVV3_9CAUL|nr:hypothetical protein [Caulobacter mirabilis]ATQ42116.1 hypothetical protein CSW64_06655 [Caulobacter mirabilis]
MHDDQDERERRRRINEAATGVYFVPGYRGHWVGAALFCATLVAAAMAWSGWPMAMSVARGEAPDGRTATTFLILYGAMIVLPAAGWALWGYGRRWTALAVVGLFAACVGWLAPAVGV